MFEILPRDWNLKPIFNQKWAPVDVTSGGGFDPFPNPPAVPTHILAEIHRAGFHRT